jgi:hypothetical protein
MSEATPADALDEQEAAKARWRAAFDDPEFMDALMLGAPVHPPDWWQRRSDEDAISYMFRMFPVSRSH